MSAHRLHRWFNIETTLDAYSSVCHDPNKHLDMDPMLN